MKYTKYDDRIVINGLDEFNIEHILMCGQVFRFEHIGEEWTVYSADKRAIVYEDRTLDIATIYTKYVDYFEHYFDLTTSYSEIKEKLRKKNLDFLNLSMDKYYGIRILNQDINEAFFSFLISSNNNIRRIQKIIFTLCENIGERVEGEDYNAFPTYEKLLGTTIDEFRSYGLGYRAKYFYDSLRAMDKYTLQNMRELSPTEIRKRLMKFCGVGEKVADCVMLFGYGYSDSFPCDVWIEKMYNTYFEQETDRSKISRKLVEFFGELSGYAQQYLFYYIKTL